MLVPGCRCGVDGLLQPNLEEPRKCINIIRLGKSETFLVGEAYIFFLSGVRSGTGWPKIKFEILNRAANERQLWAADFFLPSSNCQCSELACPIAVV